MFCRFEISVFITFYEFVHIWGLFFLLYQSYVIFLQAFVFKGLGQSADSTYVGLV